MANGLDGTYVYQHRGVGGVEAVSRQCRGSVEAVSIDTGVNGVDPCQPVSTRVRGRIGSLYACHMS